MRIFIIILVGSCVITEGILIGKIRRTIEPVQEGIQDFAKHLYKGQVNTAFKNVTDGLSDAFQRAKEALLVAPGTNWCGAGNVADHFNDLGFKFEADVCCREHDHCFDNIGGGKEKHGLVNPNSFTMSHCDCEKNFFRCLKEGGTIGATAIGFFYFNVLRPKCFDFDYPAVDCIEFGKIFPKTQDCQQYVFDSSLPKLWQMLDALDWKGDIRF